MKLPWRWNLKSVFITWLLAMVIVLAFTMPNMRPIDLDEVRFHTAENSELYFKNVRSYFYEIWDDPKSGFIHYRIKSRNREKDVPSVNFLILHNWRFDEAYVVAEGNESIETLEGLDLLIVSKSDSSRFSFKQFTNYEHWQFAGAVYMALNEDVSRFWLSSDREVVEIYTDDDERKSVQKTLNDYFKLVGKIQ